MAFTDRRSIAERGGCFQRRLFVSLSVCLLVCLFVCQHDDFRTIKLRMMKLGRWVHCTEVSPSSNLGVKGQRSRSPGTKKRKTVESSPLTMHVNGDDAARSSRRYHCVSVEGDRVTAVDGSTR